MVLELILSAERCVDVFQFEFVQTGAIVGVREALIAAAGRGVSVRVLLDDEVDDNAAAVEGLRAGGVDARRDMHAIRTHLKVVAVDGDAVLIGSTNFSGASFGFNHETNALVRDPAAVAHLIGYLDALWADPNHDPATARAAGANAIVPWLDGGYATLAAPAIDRATRRVDLIVYGLNLDPRFPDGPVARLAEELYAARRRGVPVRVLLERSSWNDGLNTLNEAAAATLRASDVEVRFDDPDTVTHAKLLLTDDVAFVGTNNWGYNGLIVDHEAGVMIEATSATQPALTSLSAYFAARWAEGN